jgi:hypothetical protein
MLESCPVSYLYAFLDESGNLDFSPTGTPLWSVTSMLLYDPTACMRELFELKKRLLDAGHDLFCFHATEDQQAVRDEVFAILSRMLPSQCRVDSVIVQKNRANPSIHPPVRFYPMMVEEVLKFQFTSRGGVDVRQFDKVLVFIDRPSQRGEQFRGMVKAIKSSLPRHLGGVPYELFFHPSSSHHGLQMADYFSWAVYVKHARNEMRPYSSIKHLVRSEFDIFAQGGAAYY